MNALDLARLVADNEVQRQAVEIRDLKQQQKDEITTQNAKILRLEQQVAELIDLKREVRLGQPSGR